ncbi:MAG: hypothetical protein WEE20_09260 [Bacteroidota bacterium]
MTHGKQQDRVPAAMLKRLDVTLQEQYHQSLAEVLAELRLRNVLTEVEPVPETIFSIMIHARVLSPVASPSVRQVRGALERFLSGTYGRCTVCGKAISAAVLENDPTTTVCSACRELRTLPSA